MASNRSLAVESFKVMDVLRRANELEAQGKKVIHAEVGQPETGAPYPVAQAAVEALQEPKVMGYTDAFGLLKLREKIAAHYQQKYNLSEPPSTNRIVVTTGSSGGFLLTFTACFDVGDTVAIASSGYPCYRNILNSLGCKLATIEVNEEFKLTAKELEHEIDRRKASGMDPIKGVILSSPGNPTGAMLTPKELNDLCVTCDENQIQFISDEIYHGISYGKEEATALSFSDRALVINSFSKYYSMSGWRLGWMVIPEHLIDPVNSLQQNMFINAPTISQIAALRCWETETIDILEKHVEKYRTSRSIILDKVLQLEGINSNDLSPVDGAFYVYIDLKDKIAPGFGSVAMCQAFLEEHYVAFTPGVDFEDPSSSLGDRRFRISYAGGIETAKEAMSRFAEFWPTWLERVQKYKSKST